MNDRPGYVAPAGWYVDPKTSLHLRWWSGLEWTGHIAPIPDVAHGPLDSSRDSPPTTGSVTTTAPPLDSPQPLDSREQRNSVEPDDSADLEAPLSRREKRARAAADDGPPLPPPVPRIAPVSNYGWDRESSGTAARADWAGAVLERADEYRVIPSRWSTASVWLIAFTPWLTLLSLAAALLMYAWGMREWLQYAAVALPWLFTVACAQRDVKRLRTWGHTKVASGAWSLLGAPVYLIARTVVLRRHTGIGAPPLWMWLVNLLLVAGACLLLYIALTPYIVAEGSR